MSATGVDHVVVLAPDREDAKDIARRSWEAEGIKVIEILHIEILDVMRSDRGDGWFRVTAKVRIGR